MTQPDQVADFIRVVAVCGSLRPGSYTRMALEIALRGAAELGAQTQLLDLREYELAFCNGNKRESSYPADVFRLGEQVRQAQGIILGTPEYHGSMSGVLKNALDLMGFAEFEGKMIGLVGVAGGSTGAINSLNGLRNIGRALHAWVIPEQVSIAESWKVFTPTGELSVPALETRLLDVGRQVARFAYLHTARQSREFLQLWETAPENPGGANR